MRVSKPLSAVASATAVYAFPGDVGHAEGRSISVRGTENSSLNVIANGTATFIGEDMKSASTLTGDAGCAACESIFVLLKGAAEIGDDFFVDVLTDMCKLAGAGDDDVCEGGFALEGPAIAYDMRKMTIGSKTSRYLCATLLGLCPFPGADNYTATFPSDKPAIQRPAPSGQTPLQIIHYSDIHIDPFYVEGASTNCTKKICCRNYSEEDFPGNNDFPAGPNGDHNCDAPVTLEESMFTAIEEMFPNALFSLFTGDIVDHAVWNTSEAQNLIDINDAYKRMTNHGLTVYATTGNHEASPADLFPPNSLSDGAQWVYDVLASDWTQWIGAEGAEEAREIGAYSVKYPNGNLRIISLNTNLYYVQNYWMYEEPMERDPNGQLEWLTSELDAAEKAGERVYIMGHLPLGDYDVLRDASNYFDQIVNRYEATIAALFFGHTHMDHFQIAYSDYDARSADGAAAISYIMPSMTPTSGMPSFRVYDIDPVTFAVLDHTTYIADMNNPAYQTTGPIWTKYYSAKETYGSMVTPPLTDATAELTPAFWHNVTEVLASDPTALADFYLRKSRGFPKGDCTDDCPAQEICYLQSARAQDNCATVTPGHDFSKRSHITARHDDHHDECGLSISRSTLSSMAVNKEMLEVLKRRSMEMKS